MDVWEMRMRMGNRRMLMRMRVRLLTVPLKIMRMLMVLVVVVSMVMVQNLANVQMFVPLLVTCPGIDHKLSADSGPIVNRPPRSKS